jgi:eukaryotic-like serine/threonine-protein kinase
MSTMAQQIPPGEQIGPYQVVRGLGAGGMGEVYLARHRHLNRDAAVKVLRAEISMHQSVVARFFTEARATAQLRHPNIVEIFDCDILPDGRAYIVMEYLRGESLRSTLNRLKTLSPDYGSIAAIAGMVADGLAAAHDSGIVHRDLKPDNTYLTTAPGQAGGMVVKILDFGIAKLLSAGDSMGGAVATSTGAIIGTPLYMSPEQCRGVSTIDHRADIYSLGCMVFEMVAGVPPFSFDAPGDILMAHIAQPAPSLTSFRPDLPPELDAMVARMLAKDPADRPQAMAEVVAAVEGMLGLRRTELARALRKPPGFPEKAQRAVTEILPPEGLVSPRPTPSPAGLGSGRASSPAGFPATTPLNLATGTPDVGAASDGGRPATATPARDKSSPGAAGAMATEPPPYATTDLCHKPSPVRRFLPAMVILAIVGIGSVTTYLLTRPSPAGQTQRQTVEKPAPGAGAGTSAPPAEPAEVEIEISTEPAGAAVWMEGEPTARGSTPMKLLLPRSADPVDVLLKANGYADKRLSVDASRDRTVSVHLEARAPVPPAPGNERAEGSAPKRPPSKKKPKPAGSAGFKAVGD